MVGRLLNGTACADAAELPRRMAVRELNEDWRMRLGIGLLLLVSAAGCSTAARSDAVANTPATRDVHAARCYQVEIGAWTETRQPKGLVPPAESRLDTAPSTWRFAEFEQRYAGREVVRHALPELGRVRPTPGMWYRIGEDSLRLQWNSGFSTAGYRLAIRGDSVEGIATTRSDMRIIPEPSHPGFPDPTASVRGLQVPCSG